MIRTFISKFGIHLCSFQTFMLFYLFTKDYEVFFIVFIFLLQLQRTEVFLCLKKKTQKHGHIEGAINNPLSETETCSLRGIFLIALLILF